MIALVEKFFIYLMIFSLFVIFVASVFVFCIFIGLSIDRILGEREEDHGLILGMSMTEDETDGKTDEPPQDTNQPMSRKSRRMKNHSRKDVYPW